MLALHQGLEETQEEGDHQVADVQTVHICVGRQDHMVIAQIVYVFLHVQALHEVEDLFILVECILLEVTRFKGLGEISPSEFKAFIGKNMRLTPVTVLGEHSIGETLGFYMGKNTQERRSYIMDNLVIEEEVLA